MHDKKKHFFSLKLMDTQQFLYKAQETIKPGFMVEKKIISENFPSSF